MKTSRRSSAWGPGRGREAGDTGGGREDLPAVEAELSRERLQRCAGEDESISLAFRMKRGGSLKNYLLQSIRTRNSDDHHIVIGVRPE